MTVSVQIADYGCKDKNMNEERQKKLWIAPDFNFWLVQKAVGV